MKIIEKLSEMIEEEIEDADKYIHCAMNMKDERPLLAEVFYKLSTEEMQHMAALHDQAAKIIDEYRKAKGDPPPAMLAVYDYLHKKHKAKAAEVKNMQLIYKSSPM